MDGFTMRKNEQYHIHHLGKAIYFRKSFLEATGTMGTPEYQELMRLQEQHPDFELRQWSIAEPKKRKESYKGLTVAQMEAFLEWKYKDNPGEYATVKAEFDSIRGFCDEFHKSSTSGNLKTWFLGRYKDEYLNWAKKKAKKPQEPQQNASESNENVEQDATTEQ